ncbi:hypothetical protein FKW77_006380 [Venturia effusa]|uniref:Uncharacterized protein n=1 Tax=Venturia effusa TaxID=50376 RepID=A0A517LDW2_9PEZI|nr:hypothetical protein FKW77_006380 [Venturia effusa]
MPETDPTLKKAKDVDETTRELPETEAGDPKAEKTKASDEPAGPSTADDDKTIAGNPSAVDVMADVAKEDDLIRAFNKKLPFKDVLAVHEHPDRNTQDGPGKNAPLPAPNPDFGSDFEMFDAKNSPLREVSPTSACSSDLDISWREVLMGNIGQSEGLLFLQFKSVPPLVPIECWKPWLFSINETLDAMIRECISESVFLEYVVLCRVASLVPSKHPSPYGCIIFIMENCVKTAHRGIVMRVDDYVLHCITDPRNLEELRLSPIDDHEELKDKAIFKKPYRSKQFGEWLATGRSEEKLTHAIKTYLYEDQGGRPVKLAPRPRRPLRP